MENMGEEVENFVFPQKTTNGKKVRLLRRIGAATALENPKINNNLQNLEQNNHKKKLAQKFYYLQSQAQPMYRGPVHQRLGGCGVRVLKKRVRNENGIYTSKFLMTKTNLFAQKRLEKFRQNINNPNKKVLLHRAKPKNLTIQVRNNTATQVFNVHSVRASINQQLQAEIKCIQAQCTEYAIIPDIPIYSNKTKIHLNDRFSQLP